jgi:hypothetical protein
MKQEFVDRIVEATAEAKGIAWDTCHKIYILMDDAEMALMREYEYDPLISSDQMGPDEMTATVVSWYEESCGLRFISAVSTNKDDPNAGFESIIEQFEDEDEDELCTSCGSDTEYSNGLCYECYENGDQPCCEQCFSDTDVDPATNICASCEEMSVSA